jgi:hypothetical protein
MTYLLRTNKETGRPFRNATPKLNGNLQKPVLDQLTPLRQKKSQKNSPKLLNCTQSRISVVGMQHRRNSLPMVQSLTKSKLADAKNISSSSLEGA